MREWLVHHRWLWIAIVVLLMAGLMSVRADTQIARAQSESPFEIRLSSEYVVNDDSSTTVEHTFSITNTTPTQYLREYGLRVHYGDISDITAKSGNTDLTPQVETTGSSSHIQLTFPDEVVGQGNTRSFTISYRTRSIATIAGSILEVQIPPLRSEQPYAAHTMSLRTPLKFGRPNRSTIDPTSVTLSGSQIETRYEQTINQTISALYGEQQIFNLSLRYNLENNSSNPGLAQIALPPDTSFQRVYYHSLEPYPEHIKVDPDGNWIATYSLPPHSASTAYLTLSALISLEPHEGVRVILPLKEHTQARRYWDSDQSRIIDLARQHTSLKESYDYVVSQLSYNYTLTTQSEITERLGAATSLEKPNQAVCQEFTDVFIALARARGVAARRLTGYAYTQNTTQRPLSFESDVLHAWPEYFSDEEQLWRPVDPTWEHTTGGTDYFTQFDLNHIVFAINGVSSTAPFPAGSYKQSQTDSRDIEVGFADTFPNDPLDLAISVVPYRVFGMAVPGKYLMVIKNQTGLAWYDRTVTLQSPSGESAEPQAIPVAALLPYQSVQVPIAVQSSGYWPLHRESSIVYQVQSPSDETPSHSATIDLIAGPGYLSALSEDTIALSLGGILIVGTLVTGGVLVFRQQRKRSLRR